MSLASYEEANRPLDQTKIAFANAPDAESEATQADTIVKSALADIYPDNVNLWDAEPAPPQEATPSTIAVIASFLMASFRYAKRYSEEAIGESNYATQLWDRAMLLLEGLRSGKLGLADVTYDSAAEWNRSSFWPNDQTFFEGTSTPLRAFTMEDVF